MTEPSQPDAQTLRTAYLELLKLSLCDLAGASTREVRWTGDRRVFSRTLTGEEQIANRRLGKDWPLDGLTMVGMSRLDDLQACVESVVADGVEGDLIEAGAWRGGASILIRATLDSLGAHDRTLWVADSFQGFAPPEAGDPEADRELETHMSQIGFLAPSVETVKGYFERFGVADNVNFVPGYFEETMAGLSGRRWSLVRLDADTYRATRLTLDALYPGLANGGYLVIDDYFHPYLPESCRKAVDDFRAEHSIEEPVEQIDWNGGRWRKRTEPEPVGETAAQTPEAPRRPPARDADAPIPTDRELQLKDELAALQARVEELEGLLRRRPGSPIAGLLARARRGARR
ncbi:MAG TPA: TylF/MycF/NovP-related O-methyltransferase [Solirubrobacteraceae bacterium]|jgi:O-methyltransferase